jgi:hypothetical protein
MQLLKLTILLGLVVGAVQQIDQPKILFLLWLLGVWAYHEH